MRSDLDGLNSEMVIEYFSCEEITECCHEVQRVCWFVCTKFDVKQEKLLIGGILLSGFYIHTLEIVEMITNLYRLCSNRLR